MPDEIAADRPAEVLPEVPPAAAARLRWLFDRRREAGGFHGVDDFRSRILEWLALATDARLLIPQEFIVPLLDTGDLSLWSADLSVVVGERGRHLARGNLVWESRAWARPPGDPAVELRRGSRVNRIRALEILRAADPGRGRELLAAAGAVGDIRTLFGAMAGLRVGLGPDDEPFLESLLAGEADPLVKDEAKELLWLLPGSAFSERARARAWATVRISRSPAGVAVSVIGSPSTTDLRDIVSWTQPSDWPTDVLRAVARTEWAFDVMEGIVRFTWRVWRNDPPPGFRELTRTLIELADPDAGYLVRPSSDDASQFVCRLPPDEAEDLIVEQLRDRPAVGLHLGSSRDKQVRWGMRRSAAYLHALISVPRASVLDRSGTWYDLRRFAQRGDPALLEEAETVLTGLAEKGPIAEQVRWALDELRLRRLMQEEIHGS
jgi:hypothetical protein